MYINSVKETKMTTFNVRCKKRGDMLKNNEWNDNK